MAWKSGQSYSTDLRSRVLAAIDGGGSATATATAQLSRSASPTSTRRWRGAKRPVIPTVLVHDRFGPIPGGDGSDLTWDGAETVPGVAAGINDRLVAVVDAGVEEVVA